MLTALGSNSPINYKLAVKRVMLMTTFMVKQRPNSRQAVKDILTAILQNQAKEFFLLANMHCSVKKFTWRVLCRLNI
jgi:hypothetical protein